MRRVELSRGSETASCEAHNLEFQVRILAPQQATEEERSAQRQQTAGTSFQKCPNRDIFIFDYVRGVVKQTALLHERIRKAERYNFDHLGRNYREPCPEKVFGRKLYSREKFLAPQQATEEERSAQRQQTAGTSFQKDPKGLFEF